MDSRAAALVVVTDADRHPGPLIEALRHHHPQLDVGALWSGDPQLRPRLTVPWVTPPWLASADWERHLVSMPRTRSTWTAITMAVSQLLDLGAGSVLVLEAGAVALVGPLGAWLDTPVVARFVPLAGAPFADDRRG